MSSRRWLRWFAGTLLFFVLSIMAFNLLTDPFGVFGDPVYQWHSYDFTNNPRAAKLAYLDRHFEEYDSYILGGSLTSSYPVEQLNRYTGAKFYNLFGYGADMYKTRNMAEYVLQHYTVKNLIINISVIDGLSYKLPAEKLTERMPPDVGGSWDFPLQYLLANPRYGVSKMQSKARDSYLPQTFDVFNVETGAYDKRKRDVEPIGDLDAYFARNPVFVGYKAKPASLWAIDACVADIRAIQALCEQKGVSVTFLFSPLYYPNAQAYQPEELAAFQKKLARVTDFWDFSMSSVSTDPRFFYDLTHFRNALGTMALARMFDDTSVFVPPDFGHYVTADNVDEVVQCYFTPPETYDDTARVPVLTYHHIDDDEGNNASISAQRFEKHMDALVEAGYTAISLSELTAYVDSDAPLPEKPVVITFDDGYLSNYEYAYPILKEHGLKATVFVIGCSVGKDRYKDTEKPILPHFSYEQAAEMNDCVEIQSHTYDMHQSEAYDTPPVRQGVLRLPDESEAEYIEAFRADFQRLKNEVYAGTGRTVTAFAYPYGLFEPDLNDALLCEMGVRITLTTQPGVNTVVKGLPQSLLGLRRISVSGSMTAGELLQKIAG